MSNKEKHIQDYASPTEASKDMKDWNNSSTPSNTRQDEDKRDGSSHIHYQLLEGDNKTIKSDSTGKTDIVQKVYWPSKND